MNVTASSLRYSDGERRARFEGGVTVRSADATLNADSEDVFLQARSAPGNPQPAAPRSGQAAPGTTALGVLGGENQPGTPSQLDRIVAHGHVLIQQPNRRATGEQLVYTASDGKFVLTGSPGVPPSIFDAEHGTITGHSLTFFSRDDRVLVESDRNATVPQTRVSK